MMHWTDTGEKKLYHCAFGQHGQDQHRQYLLGGWPFVKHVHTCIVGELKPNDLAISGLFLSPASITAILVDRLLDAFIAVMLSQLATNNMC